MKPKLIYTESCLPFILEALNYEVDKTGKVYDPYGELCKKPNGDAVYKKDIIGFRKDIGLITNISQIIA